MPNQAEIISAPVESRILILRHQKVILDADLAELYAVSVKRLNEQVNAIESASPMISYSS